MGGPSPSPSVASHQTMLPQAHITNITHSPAPSPVSFSASHPMLHTIYQSQSHLQPPTAPYPPQHGGPPPGFHQHPPAPTQTPIAAPAPPTPTITQDQVTAELFRGLQLKVLQPEEAANILQQYIDTDRLDTLCQGMIDYGIGVVSNQLRAQTDVTLVRRLVISFIICVVWSNGLQDSLF